jgi:D-glycero-alpha-D-manno-heptose 1-phosphate guanylyltransferase
MIREAIILAGGLGTRLRSAVPDLPKCMAPVAGQPFISYVIKYLAEAGVNRFIFSLGYLHEAIEDYLATAFPQLEKIYVIESTPLGTGGAIQKSVDAALGEHVLVLNGDTIFKANLSALSQLHQQTEADCTLSLKPMHHFDRYGVVDINEQQAVLRFQEKKFYEQGLINGGVYALRVASLLQADFPEKFSFEKDYLACFAERRQKLVGHVDEAYFIDIGIPEDFARAQTELAQ